MSGAPAFQANAFQNSAFQSAPLVIVIVAGDYSLGSPAFATPALSVKYTLSAPNYSLQSPVFATPGRTVIALSVNPYSLAPLGWPLTPPSLHFNYHFTAASYALQSPVFATPTLHTLSNVIHANPYSLGSPIFATPTARQAHEIHVNAYATGSPAFGSPQIGQNYHLFANAWALKSPDFGSVGPMTINYHFTAPAYSLGPLYFLPPQAPITVDYTLHADAYWLQSPWPNHPRLVVEAKALGFPPTYYTQAENAANVLTNLLNLILKSIPAQQTKEGDQVRRLVGIMRGNAEAEVRGDTLGTDLQAIYVAAEAAGATFLGMDDARKYLMSQVASESWLTQALFRSALVMTLAEMTNIIARTTLTNQSQVQNLMIYMRDAFDAAKAMGIDEVDALVYRTLNDNSGALMNHLGYTELQLPRYVSYRSGMPMPSLYLAYRIYQDPTRATEIEQENDVIHPAFCPVNLRVLSNTGVTISSAIQTSQRILAQRVAIAQKGGDI